MCAATGRPPAFETTVGRLAPGTEYHDPNGERWMVIDLSHLPTPSYLNGSTMVVNMGNGSTNRFGNAFTGNEYQGRVTPVYASIKLRRDHKGTLYTSTALNGWQCEPDQVEDTLTKLIGYPPVS